MIEASKQTWRNFICSSPTGGRFLSSIGTAVLLARDESGTAPDILRLLESLKRGQRDIRLVASVVDLLNPEYLEFLTKDMPVLLDHLASEVVKQEEVVGPGIRGNPRWDRTYLGRLTGVLPVGKYYSRVAKRSFERPENQLIKWLLDNLLSELHHLERQLGIDSLPAILKNLLAKVEAVSRHHWLADVQNQGKLMPEMSLSAQRSRRPEYRKASLLANRRAGFDREIAHGKLKSVLALLAAGWLEPIEPDDLFELYALTLCLEVLSTELGLGLPKELGLVVRQRQYVALLANGPTTVEVYFDQSPRTSLNAEGRYAEVLRAHVGISGSTHRPDITIVQSDTSGFRKTILVEVKRTQSREYLADSVYKAFAYIHDFGDLLAGTTSPKVILFVPEDTHLLDLTSVPEVAFVSAYDRAALSHLLQRRLASPAL